MSHVQNRLVYRIHDAALRVRAERYFRGRLIDIGCGTKQYEELLRPYVTEHIGVDHDESQHSAERVDVVGTAYDIPLEDASFDSAICTAVLEHLEEPERALRECFRILKPGGVAIYSVPFIWHVHEAPRDFYRFSKYGLKYLFDKVGFEIVEIAALSGFWATFGQLLVYNLYRLNRGPIARFRLLDPLGLGMQEIAYRLDRFDRTEEWTWMYMVVARRPLESRPGAVPSSER